MSHIAVIGPGKAGTAIARLALAAGHTVSIVGSGNLSDTELITRFTVPGSTAASLEDAVAPANLVIAAIPLPRFRELTPAALAGKIVIDALNLWEPTDGHIPELIESTATTSEVVQAWLSDSTVVKTLNHVGYHDLESAAGAAIGVAGTDPTAVSTVAAFIATLGFVAVTATPLGAGRVLEPGQDLFGRVVDADRMRAGFVPNLASIS